MKCMKMASNVSTTHPFGRENEISLKQLYTFFCNNIYLGQWELARACINELNEQRELLGVDIIEILRKFAINGNINSLGSSSLSSPEELSYLATAELKHYACNKGKILDELKKDTDFKILLIYACEEADPSILKELYLYHRTAHCPHLPELPNFPASTLISQQCIVFLQDLLTQQPVTGHWLLQALEIPESLEKTVSGTKICDLNQLYLLALEKQLLSLIEASESLESEKLSILRQKFYSTLSYFNLDLSKNEQNGKVKELFSTICDILDRKGSLLDRGCVYSALQGRETTDLIREFCRIELSRHLSTCSTSDMIPKDAKDILMKISQNENRQCLWQHLYFFSRQKGRHMFDILIESALEYVKTGECDKLGGLLSIRDFQVLKPLVVLLGWDMCNSLECAKGLISTLHDQGQAETKAVPTTFTAAADKLKFQVDLMNWCLQTSGCLKAGTGSLMPVLHSLEGHSVLYSLHHCCKLSTLQPDQVISRLYSGPVSICGTSEESRPDSSIMDRDVNLYRGYLVISMVMDAVISAMNMQVAATRGKHCSGLNSGASLYSRSYQMNVVDRLQEAKKVLNEINPANYRLEIMENLFSLLFVNNDHFSEDTEKDSEESGELIEEMVTSSQTVESLEQTDNFGKFPAIEVACDASKEIDNVHNISETDFNAPALETAGATEKGLIDSKKVKLKGSPHETFQVERVDYASSGFDQKPKESGEQSTQSNTSSRSLVGCGLLNNPYVIRDLLYLLRESLQNLKSSMQPDYARKGLLSSDFEQGKQENSSQNSKQDPDKLSDSDLACSISKSCLQQKLSQLDQYISEAIWRLHVVTAESISPEFGKVTGLPSPVESFGDITGFSSDEDEKLVADKRSLSVQEECIDSSDESESFAATTDSNSAHSSSSQRRRNKRKSENKWRHKGEKATPSIVSLMLADGATLLTLCLKQGRYLQAQQVAQLLQVKDSLMTAEVHFAEQYLSAQRKVQSLHVAQRAPVSTPRLKSTKGSLSAIAHVASAGLTSMSVSTVLESLLGSSNIPQLTFEKVMEIASRAPNLVKHVHVSHIPAMVTFDLAFNASKSGALCRDILKVAHSKAQGVSLANVEPMSKLVLSGTDKGVSLPGYLPLLYKLSQLLQSRQTAKTADGPMQSHLIISEQFHNQSLAQHMNLATYPLNIKDLDALVKALTEGCKWLRKMQKAWNDVAGTRSPYGTIKPTKLHGPVLRNVYGQSVEALQECQPSSGIAHFLYGRSEGDQTAGSPLLYMDSVQHHVRSLAALISQAHNASAAEAGEEYFKVLLESPTRTFGKLVFVSRIPPYSLEAAAAKLHVNLTHVIVNNCAPEIPGRNNLIPSPVKGKVVQNKGPCPDHSIENPEELVRSILTRLVQLMKVCTSASSCSDTFTEAAAQILLKKPVYKEILNSLARLQAADLSKLTTNQDKLCFFTNLWSLMQIHRQLLRVSALTSKEHAAEVRLHPVVPKELTSVVEKSEFVYHIGSAGLISQYDIEHRILKTDCQQETMPGDHLWQDISPLVEPKLPFFLSEGNSYSPQLQILHPQLVQNQLNTCVANYLDTHLTVQQNKLHVPKMLVQYFGFSASNDLRLFLVENAKQSQADWARYVLQSSAEDVSGNTEKPNLEIHIKVTSAALCYTFDSAIARNVKSTVKSHRRQVSLPIKITPDHQECQLPQRKKSFTLTPKQCYNLTPVTLDFLKVNSQLVATLMSVVCSDEMDDIEYQMEDNYFEDVSLDDQDSYQRASTESGQLDIRSYRYHSITENYPVLCRHLLYHVIPLLEAKHPGFGQSPDVILKTMTSSLDSDTRMAILTMPQNESYHQTIRAIIWSLLQTKSWQPLLEFLDFIPEQYMGSTSKSQWLILKDHIFCSYISCENSTDDNTTKSKCLLSISDPVTQVNLIFSALTLWDVDAAIKLLKYCQGRLDLEVGAKDAVKNKIQKLETYRRVTECAKNLQIKKSFKAKNTSENPELTHEYLDTLCKWQNVMQQSYESPSLVLDVLLQSLDFHTARDWAKLHKVPKELKQKTEMTYVASLLEKEPPAVKQANKVLEEYYSWNQPGAYVICTMLLDQLQKRCRLLHVVQFVLEHYTDCLSEATLRKMQLIKYGTVALCCIPDHSTADYEHLVEQPAVLLEQLLMNMKVDWLQRVLASWAPMYTDMPVPEVSQQVCDSLLAKYATQALEFPVIAPTAPSTPGTLSRSQSRLSLSSQSGADVLTSPTGLPKGPLAAIASMTRSTSMTRAQSRVSLLLGGAKECSPIPMSMSAAALGRRAVTATSPMPAISQGFVMPPEAPSREQWVPDSAATHCMVCQKQQFSMFNRRHHCRRCGRVVCGSCSQRTSHVQGISVRTCDQCYFFIYPDKSEIEKLKISGGFGVSPSPRPTFIVGSAGSFHSEGSQDEVTVECCIISDFKWTLDADPERAEQVRQDFYYDHAPSVSLCLSLLELHSDARSCGHIMLSLCEDISRYLQPVAPDVHNPEIDYSFVISMLKYLLFNAKVKLLGSGDSAGVGNCDLLLGRVDLLKQLVNAHCSYIPSLQQLSKMDTLRRLRDQLIEEEHLELAMEVSTKCGIDPTGVHLAWGMACLHVGNYTAARDKFAKCLKAPKDKNQVQPLPKHLEDLLKTLEKAPPPRSSQETTLVSQVKNMKDILTETGFTVNQKILEEIPMENRPQYRECLNYLSLYGTHNQMITFLCEHSFLHKALQYVLDKKCSSDVFVESLLVPNLQAGHMNKLQGEMLALDPSLQNWSLYLPAICKYLDRHKWRHSLYKFQLFMKDFVRAAMTCIQHFYEPGASSYAELHKRLSHLQQAKHHLEAYLDQRQWGAVPRPTHTPSKGPPIRMIMTPSEVNKNINIISLQIEVTKFLNNYLEGTEGAPGPSMTSLYPTLFGSTKKKAEVVEMIMLSGNNVNNGFGLAFRIIQDFRLDCTSIYSQAGKKLASQGRYTSIQQLLCCVRDSGLCTDQMLDEVIMACIEVIKEDQGHIKEAETLIKQLRQDTSKITANMMCGKLKSAYLVAVKAGRLEDVKAIANAADRLGQAAVKSICVKYLSQHGQTI